MKQIYRKRLEIDPSDYKKRSAFVTDATDFIDESTIVYDTEGVPQILYVKMDKIDTSGLRWAVKNQKYSTHTRSQGLQTSSAVFGYSPRVTYRNDFCTTTAMAEQYPKQHYIISNFIQNIHQIYAEYFPNQYEYHQQIVKEKVLDDWTIENTPFTSGIVNKNNQLKYHYDAGNFKGVLSNMVVLKKGVQGGHLVIPEFDLIVDCADNSLVIFNGQDLVHGVSPIEYEDEGAYRYSVVYYSLEQMWKCEPIDEEIERIKKVKTEREKKRIDPEHMAELEKAMKASEEKNLKELERFNATKNNQ